MLAASFRRDLRRVVPIRVPPSVAIAGSVVFALTLLVVLARPWRPRRPGAAVWVARGDAGALSLALVLALQAPFAKRLWRSMSARMAAVEARDQGLARDPWGGRWHVHPGVLDSPIWSAGPNGVDEGMGGDDVVVNHGFGGQRQDLVYLDSPRLLVVAGTMILGTWLLARTIVLVRRLEQEDDHR